MQSLQEVFRGGLVMIQGNPDDPIFQLRLIIGDTEEFLIADNVLSYILDSVESDVNASAIKALECIVSSLSSQISHSVGEVDIDASRLYEQKKTLLEDLKSNPSFSVYKKVAIYVGGTLLSEEEAVEGNEDSKLPPIKSGFYTDASENN